MVFKFSGKETNYKYVNVIETLYEAIMIPFLTSDIKRGKILL